MKRPRLRLFGVAFALVSTFSLGYLASRVRAAGIPASGALTYSGTLTDLNGTPLTGSKNVLLQIYAMATGGTALCASTPISVTLVGGTFQVPLGDDCINIVHANADLWIDVLIDGASIGRSKLGAVPYAVEADTAQKIAGRRIARITQCTFTGNPTSSGSGFWHYWATGECDQGLPAGTCVGFLSHAEDSGADEDWRVLLVGEKSNQATVAPAPAPNGGISWWNSSHNDGSTDIRAVYMCDQ